MMKHLTACFAVALSMAGVTQSSTVSAQDYPTRPVTIVVPYPAGALTDAMARILQSKMSDALGQPVVIENRGGAGGVNGSALVTRAQPDGYTLLVTVNAPIVMAPALQKSYPFDPTIALSGVSQLAETYLALAVHKDSPIRSIADVVRLAKEKPDQLSYGSAGFGSTHQIVGELLKAKTDIRMTHVPFQGGAPAVQNLIGGHLDMSFATLPSVLPFVQGGSLRLVALAEPMRYKELPDLPTINETIPDLVQKTTSWLGMFAPAGTPIHIRERLHRVIAEAMKSPDIIEKMKVLGMVPALKPPAEFDRTIADDLKFWTAVVQTAKIEKQ